MKKILLMLVIMIAGCTTTPGQAPITEISIPGHANQIYTFANDIRESLEVSTNDPEGIKAIGNNFTKMNIVFDGSNDVDNGYFRVTLVNFLAKIPIYYSYEGRLVKFDSFYFIDDVWYNSSAEVINEPVFEDPVLWLVGPSNAEDTSVNLVDNTIYLSGTSYKNLTLAGDKLTLILFGIDKI